MWYTGSPCELQQRRSAHTYVVHGGQNAHMGLDLSVTRDPSFCRAELRRLQAGCIDDPRAPRRHGVHLQRKTAARRAQNSQQKARTRGCTSARLSTAARDLDIRAPCHRAQRS